MWGVVLLTIAAITLLHAAYSTTEYLSHFSADIGVQTKQLPTDVYVECLLALILGTVGGSLNAPPLKEISWASEMRKRSIDEMDSRTGFAGYNRKARALFGL